MSIPEETAPYGTGPAVAARLVRKRIRTHHLQQLKEQGEKWTMLTAYDQYTAAIFDVRQNRGSTPPSAS